MASSVVKECAHPSCGARLSLFLMTSTVANCAGMLVQTRPKLDVIVVIPPARRMFRASQVSPGSRRCVGLEVLS